VTAISPHQTINPLRAGAAGALGAISLLWLGTSFPLLFQAGTVLLTLCLIPVAAGLSTRSGMLLGVLFAVLWIAARLGADGRITSRDVFSAGNLAALVAMSAVGGLAAALFGRTSEWTIQPIEGQGHSGTGESAGQATVPSESTRPQSVVHVRPVDGSLARALTANRDWLRNWDRREDPWGSFDTHAREVLHQLVGARRVRCFRLDDNGRLRALNRDDDNISVEAGFEPLVHAIITHGQRHLLGSEKTGSYLKELASQCRMPPQWIVPVINDGRPIGVFTVGEIGLPGVTTDQLERTGDVVEFLWQYVHQANELRLALLMDRATGVLSRPEFLVAFNELLSQCKELNEPVAVLAIGVEGLRGLDDAGQWQVRDEIVESIGQALRNGLRKDDVLGRLTDSQFVAVLRRLDVSLAELICRKLIGSIQDLLSKVESEQSMGIRAGVAGSGFQGVPSPDLLQKATDALHIARRNAGSVQVSGLESSDVNETKTAAQPGGER
jgi:diguanylate cyclase